MIPASKKPWMLSLILALSCLGMIFLILESVPHPLSFGVLDVGQGDALYLRTPQGKQVLIDTGGGPQILEALGQVMPFFDRTLDLLVITHPDKDHFGGAQDVLSHYEVGAVLLSGVANEDPAYLSLLQNIRTLNIPIVFPDHAHDIWLEHAVFLDVLYPFEGRSLLGQQIKNRNSASLVMRLMRADEPLILLTGDMEKDQEALLIQSGQDLSAPILKVGHHGSKTSSSPEFLKAVGAKTALISAGRDNSFGHPHAEVLERLIGLGIDIHSTAEEGTISFEWK